MIPKYPSYTARLHEGHKGLVVGIANEQSIAWGCAAAFRGLGAEVAITYRNEKTKKYVEPLARASKKSGGSLISLCIRSRFRRRRP
jgi:enoyl-[acyl-carrier protein] reductase I